jgi:hypothetical protein
MDGSTVVRIISGILAVVVLGVIIWRRKREALRLSFVNSRGKSKLRESSDESR